MNDSLPDLEQCPVLEIDGRVWFNLFVWGIRFDIRVSSLMS